MEEKEKILAVFADGGGLSYTDSILTQLQTQFNVDIVADQEGKAKETLAKRGIPCTEMQFPLNEYSLVLCGTNGKARTLQRNITHSARLLGVKVVWLEDLSGTAILSYALGAEPRLEFVHPDHICFFSSGSRWMYFASEPGLRYRGGSSVIGNPSFDVIPAQRTTLLERRKAVREKHGIGDDEEVLVYLASSSEQFNLWEDSLEPIVARAVARGARLVARLHPADPRKAELEGRVREKAGALLISAPLDQAEAEAIGDVAFTDYSTVGFRTALLGVVTLFNLSGPSTKRYLEKDGLAYPYFPIFRRGKIPPLALGVFEQSGLIESLDAAFDNASLRSELQQAYSYPEYAEMADGGAGGRALDEINRLIFD